MVRPDRARRGARRLPKLSRDLDRIAKEGIDDLRKILPLSRGGSVPGKQSKRSTSTKPLKTTTRTPESYARSAAIVEGVRDVGRAIGNFRLPEARNPFRRDDTMNREDAIRRVVNDRTIKITPAMMEVINDDDLQLDDNGEFVRRFDLDRQFERQNLLPREQKKRKVSPYQKELGKQLKMLKKKHPRTSITRLMKRAHRLTKKAMK